MQGARRGSPSRARGAAHVAFFCHPYRKFGTHRPLWHSSFAAYSVPPWSHPHLPPLHGVFAGPGSPTSTMSSAASSTGRADGAARASSHPYNPDRRGAGTLLYVCALMDGTDVVGFGVMNGPSRQAVEDLLRADPAVRADRLVWQLLGGVAFTARDVRL